MPKGKVLIKSDYDIMKIAEVGHFNAMFFDELTALINPGITTQDIENYANEFAERYGLNPCFKEVPGYHHAVCASVNEQVVHGIPSPKKKLKKGDIVAVDIGFQKEGYISDSAYTYMVGKVSETAQRLCAVTKESLERAIAVVRPGATLGDIGHAIQSFVEAEGFSVVREYVGHGVGFELHEPPSVYHFGNPGEGLELVPGMVFAIEPMINEGDWKTKVLKDGWTVITKDKKLSAQYEHTVAVTKDGCKVLTQ